MISSNFFLSLINCQPYLLYFLLIYAKTIYVRNVYKYYKKGIVMSNKKNAEVLASIWDRTGDKSFVCPQCGSSLTMIQIEPVEDTENAYTPYKTIIECDSCSFKLETVSFTILGSVKDFDAEYVEIGSWGPSGSRILSRYEHILDYNLLKDLKKSAELVEFLVVNNQVVQVVG